MVYGNRDDLLERYLNNDTSISTTKLDKALLEGSKTADDVTGRKDVSPSDPDYDDMVTLAYLNAAADIWLGWDDPNGKHAEFVRAAKAQADQIRGKKPATGQLNPSIVYVTSDYTTHGMNQDIDPVLDTYDF